MHPFLIAVIATVSGGTLSYLATQSIAKKREELMYHLMAQNTDLTAENQFLQQELDIAVSISKRLNEALVYRFTGVYGSHAAETEYRPFSYWQPKHNEIGQVTGIKRIYQHNHNISEHEQESEKHHDYEHEHEYEYCIN